MIKILGVYFQFFTRLPIPVAISNFEAAYRRGFWAFGLFALFYSGITTTLYAASRLVFDVDVAVLVFLLGEVVLTGGFHHDALADTMDGLGSGRSCDQMLQIMKDSRIGTHGTLALIIYFLFLSRLPIPALTAAGNLVQECLRMAILSYGSRGILALMHRSFRYASATAEGLGAMLIGIPTWQVAVSQIPILVALALSLGPAWVLIYAGVALLMEGYKRAVMAKLDGMNGDTTGATVLLSQMGLAMCLYLFAA